MSFQTSPLELEEASNLLLQTINSCAKKGEQVNVEDLLRKINKEGAPVTNDYESLSAN
jgi:hypothetical protein